VCKESSLKKRPTLAPADGVDTLIPTDGLLVPGTPAPAHRVAGTLAVADRVQVLGALAHADRVLAPGTLAPCNGKAGTFIPGYGELVQALAPSYGLLAPGTLQLVLGNINGLTLAPVHIAMIQVAIMQGCNPHIHAMQQQNEIDFSCLLD